MQYPQKLREAVRQHLPELAQNPDKLTLFVTGGRVMASKGTLSHETRYRLSLIITDFTGDVDVLNAVVIDWLQEYSPETIGPGDTAPSAYTFEIEHLGNRACDILIELELTERTVVLTDDAGNIRIEHPRNANRRELMNTLGIEDGRLT